MRVGEYLTFVKGIGKAEVSFLP